MSSRLPLLLNESDGPNGSLLGHFAKANPQWESAADQAVLACFDGPHAYISPTWYAEPNVVPTWNYLSVQAQGTLQLIEDAEAVLDLLHKTVAVYEADESQPWSVDSQPPEFIQQLADAVVAFRIPIEQLAGKEKLSQNQSVERQQRVIAGLRNRSRGHDPEVAQLMEAVMQRN
ncbi:MAG: FMN-binding negative transcriptional regulator [Fuerstiella sp.]